MKPSVDFFASIDLRTSQLFHEKGRLVWLIKADNKRKGWGYEFEQFGIYRVAVRKCIPQKLQPYQLQYMNNRYMLISVLEENASNEKLEALKEHYAKPISMENELGSFVLDREFSWFEGIVISEITVSQDGSLSLLYHDDNMFWGHVIEIEVESNGEIISANIAG